MSEGLGFGAKCVLIFLAAIPTFALGVAIHVTCEPGATIADGMVFSAFCTPLMMLVNYAIFHQR